MPWQPTPPGGPTGDLTSEECAAWDKQLERSYSFIPAPRLKVSYNYEPTPLYMRARGLRLDHKYQNIGFIFLSEALGSADDDFVNGLLNQLANAGSHGPKIDEDALNFMVSVIKGIKPRDQVESMLAAQMAAVHMATMRIARSFAHVEHVAQFDSNQKALNTLARTFASQMEALKRYRSGGEQKITVNHVSVSDGGQAIVGHVTHGAANGKNADTPAALGETRMPAMPPLDERSDTVVPLKPKERQR
jgi:hypothetical protein